MPAPLLKRLVVVGEGRRYSAGSALAVENDEPSAALLIVAGTIGDAQTEETWSCGTLVSELAMVSEMTSGRTIVALTDVDVVAFEREQMLNMFATYPDIADYLASAMAARLSVVYDALQQVDAQLANLEAAA